MVKMALLMFSWRREIDHDHVKNAVAIAGLETLKPDVQRNIEDIRESREKITRLYERRFGMRERDEDD